MPRLPKISFCTINLHTSTFRHTVQEIFRCNTLTRLLLSFGLVVPITLDRFGTDFMHNYIRQIPKRSHDNAMKQCETSE